MPAWRLGIADLRGEVGQAIGLLRSEMKSEIGSVRSEMKSEIGAVRADMAEMKGSISTGVKLIWAAVLAILAATVKYLFT